MPDPSYLFMPVLVFFIGLGGLTFADRQSVYVAGVGVPQSLLERGYTSTVIVGLLFARMNEITHEGRSELPGYDLVSDYVNAHPTQVLANQFGVDGLVRSIQQSMGMIEVYVQGHMTQTNDRLTFDVSGSQWGRESFRLRRTADIARVDALISQMADQIMARIDPYTYALYLFRTNLETWDFRALDDLIERAMIQSDPDKKPFFDNLAAIRAFATGDDQAAMNRLQRAIASAKLPAIFELNLGLIHKRRDRFDEAVLHFRRATEVAQTPHFAALAYAEWGSILAVRGQQREADEQFQKAFTLERMNYHIHREWGNVLQLRGQSAEADREFALSQRLFHDRPSYTEELLTLFTIWDDDKV